jgi:glycosyl hydrolase family 106( putative alpha-L-rhamnosidase)
VNHLVYHGTAYSPPDEPWPGWLFYASVHFQPTNPWWGDLAALNEYVARVQSFLQSGEPDNDVLLYFPFSDALAVRGEGLLRHFGAEERDLPGSAFDAAFDTLLGRGFGFDFVSDRLLAAIETRDGALRSAGGEYKALVLPAARTVPVETVAHALDLARAGATVIAYHGLPQDVPGLRDVEERRARLLRLVGGLPFGPPDARGVREARLGRGRVLSGDDLEALVARGGVAREPLVDRGLAFVRRRLADGRCYFVANPGRVPVDGWLHLSTAAGAVALYEPMDGSRGWARVRPAGPRAMDVYVQIGVGESLVLVTHPSGTGDRYPYVEPAGEPQVLEGSWTVRFVRGGPVLPQATTVSRLDSWTRFPVAGAKEFSGTATYTINFARPWTPAAEWRLDLGDVRDSARVRLNGRDLGTLIGPVYRLTIDRSLLADRNVLEVAVTNGMANRIADLDRRGVPWKKFDNVNFPARLPENRGADGLFTAAGWAPLDSGLLGPVTLQPLRPLADPR